MDLLVYQNFLTAYLGHVDGIEVLGHTVISSRNLTVIDPPKGHVVVHAADLQKRDANGIRSHRVRVYVYGHGIGTTEDIAEVLHSAIVGDAVLIPPNDLNQDQTFFDHVDSEQGPTQGASHGLSSVLFNFDVVAVSRAIS